MPAAWNFTLTRDGVSKDEQAHFAEDLARLGLDEVAWLVLNSSAATRTPHSTPKVLRGYRAGNLAGVAYVVECRHYGQSLFPQSRLAKLLDACAMPICIWLRQGALNDGIANPGFVASGIARSEFVAHALSFLQRTYLMGGVLEASAERTVGDYAAFPFCDNGIIHLQGAHTPDDLYADSKNLKRKVNKFRNKGGEIQTIHGALTRTDTDAAIHCLDSVKAVLTSPFQDNYNNMVRAASALADARIVHFMARLAGECVGFHSFATSGNSLYCLSGAFDRTRHTNYHAYENLILATVDYALARGLQTLYYGMVVNETKAKMMSRFVPAHQSYYTRFAPLTAVARKLMSATRLASPQIIAYANLPANATNQADHAAHAPVES